MSKLYFQKAQSIEKLLSALSYSSIFILVDENTFKYCYPLVRDMLPDHTLIQIEAGEQHKDINSCQLIWNSLSQQNADRNALLINLGGGVITDIGGFCASTYKRGIRFINLPTTLLSQVDASVGGKTGIDFNGYKNQIGVFNEPEFVLIDTSFHQTLPERELRSGFAEMLKHGLIADAQHWKNLVDSDFNLISNQLLENSVSIKQRVVEKDPNEKGLRKILNFGHTIGHALESALLNSSEPLLHGEAIAHGMRCEASIAYELEYISQEEFNQINKSLLKIYGPLKIKKALRENILRLCKQDKKNQNGDIRMSLLNKIGEANYDIAISQNTILNALDNCL
jgi:3-dehydroquinate synthase